VVQRERRATLYEIGAGKVLSDWRRINRNIATAARRCDVEAAPRPTLEGRALNSASSVMNTCIHGGDVPPRSAAPEIEERWIFRDQDRSQQAIFARASNAV
jgi:hypothetical protein